MAAPVVAAIASSRGAWHHSQALEAYGTIRSTIRQAYGTIRSTIRQAYGTIRSSHLQPHHSPWQQPLGATLPTKSPALFA
jgi:hypothetical protein